MKKNAQDKAPRKGGKPFFARLLEAQELEKVSGGRRPPIVETRKFPSDRDECDKEPPIVTLKFPSDNEESGTTY